MLDDLPLRAEIRSDLHKAPSACAAMRRARLVVGFDVGSAETIDRLLRIAHEEQRTPSKSRILPTGRGYFRGDGEDDCGLDAIGVLEFVDEEVPELVAERGPVQVHAGKPDRGP